MEKFLELRIEPLEPAVLLNQLRDCGIELNHYAIELIADLKISDRSENEGRLALVRVQLPHLGFLRPATFSEITSRARANGLELCPLYVAPYLRLVYLNQTSGPYLTVASPRATEVESKPVGFYLRNIDGTLWLRGYCASADYEFPLNSEFVFQRASSG